MSKSALFSPTFTSQKYFSLIWNLFPWLRAKNPCFSLISLTGKIVQNFPWFSWSVGCFQHLINPRSWIHAGIKVRWEDALRLFDLPQQMQCNATVELSTAGGRTACTCRLHHSKDSLGCNCNCCNANRTTSLRENSQEHGPLVCCLNCCQGFVQSGLSYVIWNQSKIPKNWRPCRNLHFAG